MSRLWQHAQNGVKRISRRHRVLLPVGIVAGVTGSLIYYMRQDVEYIGIAQGAHKSVPPLALHPVTGGKKHLPIVSHQLDDDRPEALSNLTKPRVVVLGGGWGAVSTLRHLSRDQYNVTLISDNNYFLFTPLLPSATVGTLEMRSLLEPLRKIVAKVDGHYLEGKAVDVDLEDKLVEVQSNDGEQSFYVPYDKLVIAVGSTSITHGVQGLEHTHRLKTIQDAMAVRHRITSNVEKAALPATPPEERKRLLSFVVCGGGPTGVEFAAELFDWMNEDLVKWFPKILREDISITIIQSRDHILNTFDVKISEYAEHRFERSGIHVVTDARVARIEEDKVVYRLNNTAPPVYAELPYGLCMWSTGIAMTSFAQKLADKLGTQEHRRAIQTDSFCRVQGIKDDSVYAIGDCATIENPRIIEHIMEIFKQADKNNDGHLTRDEFRDAVQHMRKRFPLSSQHLGELSKMFESYDRDKSGTIELDEMRDFIEDIDKKLTHLPATAQVASQQGAYIGKLLNQLAKDGDIVDETIGPFRYHHLGTLAYLGNTAVGEFGWGYRMVGGLWAQYLWRGIYWSKQVSMRTRLNLSIDWSKRAIFGRDLSTI